MENMKKIVGSRLRLYRKMTGMTTVESAALLGKSKQTISAWENGYNSPSLDDLVKIMDVYNVPNIAMLFGLSTINSLPESELRLLETFRKLNEEGQIKVTEYAEDLANNFSYIKSHTDGVVAAHTREISRLK